MTNASGTPEHSAWSLHHRALAVLNLFLASIAVVISLAVWQLLQRGFVHLFLPAYHLTGMYSNIAVLTFAICTLIPMALYSYAVYTSAKKMLAEERQSDTPKPAEFDSSLDRPIDDPSHDKLRFSEPAKHLAKSICTRFPSGGFVIGIYGEWGSGKTSFINLVKHHIGEENRNRERNPAEAGDEKGNQGPIDILEFHPWWFSGEESLIRRFLQQLGARIRGNEKDTDAIRDKLAQFADAVADIPAPYLSAGKGIAKLLGTKPKEIDELREELRAKLKNQARTLVVIDDIDRLSSKEICEVFRLVKAVADFPNIVYLLSMDRGATISALRELKHVSGDDYLEKIVQYPINIPLPDKTMLDNMLFERLNQVVDQFARDDFDHQHWAVMYRFGVRQFIQCPRDVVRLVNAIAVNSPAVAYEVNPVDIVAMEALRIFQPEVYSIVSSNHEKFTGVLPFDAKGSVRKELESFHRAWMEKIENEFCREAVKSVLTKLFPKLSDIFRSGYVYAGSPMWRKERRICSPDVAPIYFRMTLSDNCIPNLEIKAILSSIGDRDKFSETLRSLADRKLPDGSSKISDFLDRLIDYADEEIPKEAIPNIANVMFDVGDDLLCLEDSISTTGIGNHWRIFWIVLQLLRRLDEPARYDVMEKAISDGSAVSTMVCVMGSLNRSDKSDTRVSAAHRDIIISDKHMETLRGSVVYKIRQAAKHNTMLDYPMLSYILHCWKDWAGEHEPKEWVEEQIRHDESLIKLLVNRVSIVSVAFGSYPSIKVERFKDFMDIDKAYERLKTILNTRQLTAKEKEAVTLFIEDYERAANTDPVPDSDS